MAMSELVPKNNDISSSADNNSFGNGSCHKFSTREFQAVQISAFTITSVGALASFLVILLIVISRSYKRFVFRLIIYFMSAILFQEFAKIVKVIPVHHHEDIVTVREGWESACAAFGFLEQVSLCSNEIIVMWIMLYLLKLTWHIYRVQTGKDQPNQQITIQPQSCKSVTKQEFFGLFLVVFIPVIYCSIPFVKNMYGLSGLWCWIKAARHNCDGDYTLGLVFMFTIHFGPFFLLTILMYISLLVIVLVLCKGACEMRGLARRQYQRGTREMIIVLIMSFVYTSILALLIALRIYSTINTTTTEHSPFALWLLYSIMTDAFNVLVPLAFLVHPGTWKNMFCRKKPEDNDNTYFSVPPEDSDIDEGIKVTDSKPFNSYGSVLQRNV